MTIPNRQSPPGIPVGCRGEECEHFEKTKKLCLVTKGWRVNRIPENVRKTGTHAGRFHPTPECAIKANLCIYTNPDGSVKEEPVPTET